MKLKIGENMTAEGDAEEIFDLIQKLKHEMTVKADFEMCEAVQRVECARTNHSYSIFVKLLQERGITAYKVAKDTGISQTTLSDWKTGRATPKANKLLLLAEYFGVTVDYFLKED